ncbi:spermatogenesis-associated protein 20-like [Sycon ciliatum]|uniref:spermatogenesis-associated protein 20-like n=1 Tax=Sycon ciliatum TaxID=27933 RepID=UPI0031F5F357
MAESAAVPRYNRLATEISPYLLQHATNPIDWYPWGEEAFAKAKAEKKPIFLSVGYSTCHWCHVMERETFSKKEVANIMNKNFVSIKVDREERPDIDRVYMTFLQTMYDGEGGWPMNVWLTPNLHPFHAGTYFPAVDKKDKKAFSTVSVEVAKQWEAHSDLIIQSGFDIIQKISQAIICEMNSALDVPGPDCVVNCFTQLRDQFDVEKGGFGGTPKFPQPVTFNFLLNLYASNPYSNNGQQSLTMTLVSLKNMAAGGIHDHIGNGFHRYSTDKAWHIPHFEKMLYDQAQLCVCYLAAYQITKEMFYANVARDILRYMARDLSDSEGGFFSAEDAESYAQLGEAQKREGAFCVWRHEEIQQLLPQVVEGTCMAGRCITFWEVFCYHYSVEVQGNVPAAMDSHGDLKTQNVLKERCTVAETAAQFNLAVDVVQQLLVYCRQVLFDARRLRPRPHRDDKIVTGWNGLAISAFAKAAQALGEEEWMQRAVLAAHFIKSRMFIGGRLKRNSYRRSSGARGLDISPTEAFSPDYAYLIRGLIDLYEATFDDLWLEWAVDLQNVFDTLFWDTSRGGYFDFMEGDPSILLRLKEDQDATEPTASSVAAQNLLRLAEYSQIKEFGDRATITFNAFGKRLQTTPFSLPEMMSAYLYGSRQTTQLCIVGSRLTMEWSVLMKNLHSTYAPFKTLAYVSSPNVYVARCLPTLAPLASSLGTPRVFICAEGTCHPPTDDAITITNLLTPSPPMPETPSDYTFELSGPMDPPIAPLC